MELGSYLKGRGVLASMGHTDATIEQDELANKTGYGHMTHLYSAMSGVKRVRGRRIAGAVEAGLAMDGLTVEVIADGMHLPAGLLRLILKCKGGYIALVTDAMRAAGMPRGYLLGSGGEAEGVGGRRGGMASDRSAFAGAWRFKACGQHGGSRGQYSRCGEDDEPNPARTIGLDGSIGSIAEELMDITPFDDNSG